MKTYKIIAIIAFLSLISLSIFSMDMSVIELKENKEQRKKLYKLYDQLKTISEANRSALLSQGDNIALINNADTVLSNHIIRLQSKINKDENPLQAKWKNMAKSVVATGVMFWLAHYYLQNKQAVRDVVGDNFVFSCVNRAAQNYYEAPYRPFARVIFNGVCANVPVVGDLISMWSQLLIDRLTGFTHLVSSEITFLSGLILVINLNGYFLYNLIAGSKNDFLYAMLSGFIFSKPARYTIDQFSKVWNYKSDLYKKIVHDKAVKEACNDELWKQNRVTEVFD